ncbi:hypothetical protein K504DRAFT_23037 [Pleomassaria siparia CBS 279.74]|uniref:Uncharacterized protein n=1 Tax=Pleomassaria siparia CBS 279.74 TaxID=1314801 RepID=A0A6G1KS04_9PLEO|nr:hypothetical protein K504DRAFT_23037 [Pleomassaria siparia CBS 279.74]
MDMRRAPRPPNPSGPRVGRNMFNPQPRRPHPHLNPTNSISSSLHIPAEEADPKDDMVERDSSGNYNMAAPATSKGMRGVDDVPAGNEESAPGLTSGVTEQENQIIALYGSHHKHYDQTLQGDVMSEIKAALSSSLEKKVQSLEHDRWMFEGEGKSKG